MRKQIRSLLATILTGTMVLTSVSPAVYAGELDSTYTLQSSDLADEESAYISTEALGDSQISQDVTIEDPTVTSGQDLISSGAAAQDSGSDAAASVSDTSETASGENETGSTSAESPSEDGTGTSGSPESSGENASGEEGGTALSGADTEAASGLTLEGEDLFGGDEIVSEDDVPADGIEDQPSDLVQDTDPADGVDEEATIETITLAQMIRRAPAVDTLQGIINQALIDSVTAADPDADPTDDTIPKTAEVALQKDYSELIVIPDNCTVTLDLNGHHIYGARKPEETDTLSSITVFGTLTLKDSTGTGSLSANPADAADDAKVSNIRGITVCNKGTVTLVSGTISGYDLPDGNGAGVYVSRGGSFRMTGGTIENNTAAHYGGGLFATTVAQLKLEGGTFQGNTAENGGAAAFTYLPAQTGFGADEGNTGFFGPLQILNNTASVDGGGFYFGSGNASGDYQGTVFKGNQAGRDGGAARYATKAVSTLNEVEITENTSERYGGGFCYVYGDTLTLNSAQIKSNQAGTSGGGLIITWGGASTLTINDSEISGNKITSDNDERQGGGIYTGNYTTLTLNGTTKISGNTGARVGGGIFAGDYSKIAINDDVEIADNTTRLVSTWDGGAGIYVGYYATITMNGGVIRANKTSRSESYGGGIYAYGHNQVTIYNGLIEENETQCSGGGIYMRGGGKTTLEEMDENAQAIIQNNRARGYDGGGISANSVIIKKGTITGNRAARYGGGVNCDGFTMEDGEVSGNTSGGSGGGIISYWGAGITGGKILNNTAGGNGGGIELDLNNTAGGNGGGIELERNGSVKNCLIQGNKAGGVGGGIRSYLEYSYGKLTITDTEITENTASSGAGIYMDGDSRYWDTHINTLGEGTRITNNNATADGGGVFVRDETQCVVDGAEITGNTAVNGGGGILLERWTTRLTVNRGSVCQNQARWGKDIRMVNYADWYGNRSNLYRRPNLVLADTTEAAGNMTPPGAWMDEKDFSTFTDAFDNKDDNARRHEDDLAQAEKESGWVYENTETNLTYTEADEVVARVGSVMYPTVQSAIDAVQTAAETDENTDRVVHLLKNRTESVTVPENLKVTLDLAGYALSGGDYRKSVITVEKGADFTLEDDSEEKTGQVRGGRGTKNVPGWEASRYLGGGLFVKGKATLKSGAIRDNKIASDWESVGGGVFVAADAEFVMEGGEVCNNTADYAGGIYTTNGTVIIKGGKIHDNSAAGLYVDASTLNDERGIIRMEGGEVYNNTPWGAGGAGVYVGSNGQFVLSGGSIHDNKAGTYNGGGVLVREWGKFTMTGGSIHDNTAQNGGGVMVNNVASLMMTGGEISGNKAVDNGGGIYFYNADGRESRRYTFDLESGQVYGNTCANNASNDIFLRQGTILKKLMAASDMGVENVDCWLDGYDNAQITEALVDKDDSADGEGGDVTEEIDPKNIVPVAPHHYYLTASKKKLDDEAVARIGEQKFTSIQAAVNAAGQAPAEGEEPLGTYIYLLKNRKESVSVSYGKNLTLDLNGYTLNPETTYNFHLQGASTLILTSTQTESDANTADSAMKGWITTLDPETDQDKAASTDRTDYYRNVRAAIVSGSSNLILDQGVTIDGFGGEIIGGGIYALDGSGVEIKKGAVIQNCHGSDGGGVYVRPVNRNPMQPVHFTMTGGTIRSCTSSRYGGGVCFSTVNYNSAADELSISDSSLFTGNYAKSYGGAVFLYLRKSGSELPETMTISDSIFKKNVTDGSGSAVYVDHYSANSTITIERCTFEENDTKDNGTVRIYSDGSGRKTALVFNNNQVLNNTSRMHQAGLSVYCSKVLMDGCTFKGNTNNSAPRSTDSNTRYAIAALIETRNYSVAMTSVITNTTFEDNKSSWANTAAFIRGNFTLDHVTVTGNKSYNFAGLRIDGSWDDWAGNGKYTANGTVTNCTFTNNESKRSAAAFATGGGSDIAMEGCEVSGNTAWRYGTISIDGGWTDDGRFKNPEADGRTPFYNCIVVTNSKIHDNKLIGSGDGSFEGGGAFRLSDRSRLELGSGAEIYNNEVPNAYGGAIYARSRAYILVGSGAKIYGNKARYGGAVYLNGYYNMNWWDWAGNSKYARMWVPTFLMTGGQITGNTATVDGGAVFADARFIGNHEELERIDTEGDRNVNSTDTEFKVSGGLISGNTAGRFGGGVFTSWDGTLFQLTGGQIYGNKASVGQDIFAEYSDSYLSDKFTHRQNELRLIPAADMFPGDSGKRGVGWLDEDHNEVITRKIQGKLVRRLPLTLSYRTDEVVAILDTDGDGKGDEITNIQDLIETLSRNTYQKDGGETFNKDDKDVVPEIILVKDATESIDIPAGLNLKLNLNGYKLQGINTAVTCAGQLEIADEKKNPTANITDNGYKAGEGPGTISGSGLETGGGVKVVSGGSVKMSSGEISGCRAGDSYNSASYGGAAVGIDAGTFELTGTAKIRDNVSKYGAAVLVKTDSSTFKMTGGEICENQATQYGTIYARAGVVQITGGSILDNRADVRGGALYSAGSARVVISGPDVDHPVLIQNNIAGTEGSTGEVYGGAIFQTGARVTLGNTTISGNKTQSSKTGAGNSGGAIYVESGMMSIGDGTLITDNYANRGGALSNWCGTINMTGGLITKNHAQVGGGVFLRTDANGPSYFNLMGGGIYDNRSIATAQGNDIYSHYEGSNKSYPWNNNWPRATLISAQKMGSDKYNTWHDDSYDGPNRTASEITKGEYITDRINESWDLQLTAALYGDTQPSVVSGDFQVTELHIGKYNEKEERYDNGIADGTAAFDVASDGKTPEVKAADVEGAVDSDDTYRLNGNDEEIHYVEVDGKKYERDQLISWNDGDDTSSANGLVRSYDSVMYQLAAQIELNDGLQAKEDDAEVHVWLEGILNADPDEAEFVASTAGFKGYTLSEKTVNGKAVQVLKGYKVLHMKDAGRTSFNMQVAVHSMKNGDTFKPVFRCYVEGNKENETDAPEADSPVMTVSATGRYNLSLDYNPTLAYTSYFDLQNGVEVSKDVYQAAVQADPNQQQIIHGTMLGYGITAQMYNSGILNTNGSVSGKGMKGLEKPQGSLSFKLSMKGSLYFDGKKLDGQDATAPYFWAYKENMANTPGRPLGSTRATQNMDWNDEDDITKTTTYAMGAAPFNTGGGETACFNGGSWFVSGQQTAKGEQEKTFDVTISGYTFNSDANPSKASDGGTNKPYSGSNVKAFSAGYIQVIFPITKEQEDMNKNGYLTLHMDAVVSDLDVRNEAGGEPKTDSALTDNGITAMSAFYNNDLAATQQHALREMTYGDNYMNFETGLYVSVDDPSIGDSAVKTNYFNNGTNGGLTGSGGRGTTPLSSVVYAGSDVSFSSTGFRTDDEKDPSRYIDPEKFNPTSDNLVEYNYMTSLNLLQKFDADAYTPAVNPASTFENISTDTNRRYDRKTNAYGSAHYTWPNNYYDFYVTVNEEPAEWNRSASKTRGYKLTILFGAKPDGKNWNKNVENNTRQPQWDDGGVKEMDQYREENLLWFKSLNDLKAYFGNDDAKCVAVLYEFRDCAIRTGRSLSVQTRMNVTNDFDKTGNTYPMTNDIRAWSTYRPEYKDAYRNGKLSDLLYSFNWTSDEYGSQNGVTAYGAGLAPDRYYVGESGGAGNATPDNGYFSFGENHDQRTITKQVTPGLTTADGRPIVASRYVSGLSVVRYDNGYMKTQYEEGSQVAGTHNGWRRGNCLLLYTMQASIDLFRTNEHPVGSNTWKSTYDVSRGERVAPFIVQPNISPASSATINPLVLNGSQETDVRIRLRFPKWLKYSDKSILFDYSQTGKDGWKEGDLQWNVGQIVENPDGSSYVDVTTHVYDISKKLPLITYNAEIGDPQDPDHDVPSNQNLMAGASIYTTYSEHNNVAADLHSATFGLLAVRTRTDGIWMSTDEPHKETGEEITLTANYQKTSEGGNQAYAMTTVLPYNGDGRGTAFTGGYQVKKVVLTFNNKASYDAYKAGHQINDNGDGTGTVHGAITAKIGVSTGANAEGQSPAQDKAIADFVKAGTALDGTFDDRTMTVTVTMAEGQYVQKDDTRNGIAFGMTGSLKDSPNQIQMSCILSSLNGDGTYIAGKGDSRQKGGNVYKANYIFSDSETIKSKSVETMVINRVISGFTFLDRDKDGMYVKGTDRAASKDRLISGITATLYRKLEKDEEPEDGEETITFDGSTYVRAKDTTGHVYDPVITGAGGKYSFADVPAGSFRVIFTAPSKDGKPVYPKYAGTNTALPLPYGRLSITSEDHQTAGSANRGVKTENSYKKDGKKTAELQDSVTYMDIVMPDKNHVEAIQTTANNWNLGLYYNEIALTKTWDNMTLGMTAGDNVKFRVTAAAKDAGLTTEDADLADGDLPDATVYTITRNSTGTGRSGLTFAKENESPMMSSPATNAASEEAACPTYKWTVSPIAVQAENGDGPISLDVKEISFKAGGVEQEVSADLTANEDGSRNAGDYMVAKEVFGRTTEEPLAQAGKAGYENQYMALLENFQRLYGFGLKKVADKNHAQILEGAVFNLYLESNGAYGLQTGNGGDKLLKFTNVDGVWTLNMASGKSSDLTAGSLDLSGLPKGAYYLKETKAPAGAFIWASNQEYWKVDVTEDETPKATSAADAAHDNGTVTIKGNVIDPPIGTYDRTPEAAEAYKDAAYAAKYAEGESREEREKKQKNEDLWLIPNVAGYKAGFVKVAVENHGNTLGKNSGSDAAEFNLWFDTTGDGKLEAGGSDGSGQSGSSADELLKFTAVKGKPGTYVLNRKDGGIKLSVGDDGSLNLKGLPAGIYFLKETRIPKGTYNFNLGQGYYKMEITYDEKHPETDSEGYGNGHVTVTTVDLIQDAPSYEKMLATAPAYKDAAYLASKNLRLSAAEQAEKQEEEDVWLIPNLGVYRFGFVKVASENHGETLTGAEFRLYFDRNGDGELQMAGNGSGSAGDGSGTDELLKLSGSAGSYSLNPEYPRLLAASSLTGTETLAVASDGSLNLSGLPAGTYFLKETKAPEGRYIWDDPDEYWKIVVEPDDSKKKTSAFAENSGNRDGKITVTASRTVPAVDASLDEKYIETSGKSASALKKADIWLLPNIDEKVVKTGVDTSPRSYMALILIALAGYALVIVAAERRRRRKRA